MIGHIIGRLGKDAEVETTSGGTKVVKFKIVENEFKNGEESSTWYDCVSFNPFIIDKQIKALKKGSLVFVSGVVNVRPSFSKNGQLYINYDVVTDMVRIVNTNTKRDGTTAQPQVAPQEDEDVSTSMPSAKPKPVEKEEPVEQPTPYVDEDNDEELPF